MNDKTERRIAGRYVPRAHGDNVGCDVPMRPVRAVHGGALHAPATAKADTANRADSARVLSVRPSHVPTRRGPNKTDKRKRQYLSAVDPLRVAQVNYMRRKSDETLDEVMAWALGIVAASHWWAAEDLDMAFDRIVTSVPTHIRQACFALPREVDPLWFIARRVIRENGALDFRSIGLLYGVSKQRIEQIEVSVKPLMKLLMRDFRDNEHEQGEHALSEVL